MTSTSCTDGSVPTVADAPRAAHRGVTAVSFAVIFLRLSLCCTSERGLFISAALTSILRHSASVSPSRCLLASVTTGGCDSHSATTPAAPFDTCSRCGATCAISASPFSASTRSAGSCSSSLDGIPVPALINSLCSARFSSVSKRSTIHCSLTREGSLISARIASWTRESILDLL